MHVCGGESERAKRAENVAPEKGGWEISIGVWVGLEKLHRGESQQMCVACVNLDGKKAHDFFYLFVRPEFSINGQ